MYLLKDAGLQCTSEMLSTSSGFEEKNRKLCKETKRLVGTFNGCNIAIKYQDKNLEEI